MTAVRILYKIENGDKVMALKMKSTAFEQGEKIPAKHTCDGENISSPLQCSGIPEATKTFAILFDDPDAPAKT